MTSTKEGKFVPTAGEENWLSWLRMANDTQCIILQRYTTIHSNEDKLQNCNNRLAKIQLYELPGCVYPFYESTFIHKLRRFKCLLCCAESTCAVCTGVSSQINPSSNYMSSRREFQFWVNTCISLLCSVALLDVLESAILQIIAQYE